VSNYALERCFGIPYATTRPAQGRKFLVG
jgi:hypothetical protein